MGYLKQNNLTLGFSDGSAGKESACNAGSTGDMGLIPEVRKILWRRSWQPVPVFLPGKAQGQRSLADFSPKSQM